MKRYITTAVLLIAAGVATAAQETVSLGLSECRKMALKSSEEMQQQSNNVTSAELDTKIAKGSYLPQIDAMAMVLFMKDYDIMGYKLLLRGTWDAGITLTQPIYVGGKIRNGNKLAKIGYEAAEQQMKLKSDEVVASVDNAYYTLLAVREKVKMLEAYERQMDALYEQVSTSVSADLATQSDLLRVCTKKSEITYQLEKVRNGESLCQMSLCSAIGIDLCSTIELKDSALTITPPATLDEDISTRPEVALLNKQVEATEKQVSVSKAEHLPQVALMAGFSHFDNMKFKGTTMLEDGTAYNFEQKYSSNTPFAAVTVSIPIFHGGNDTRKVKQSKIKAENAKLDLKKNTRLMSIEARQAVLNLTSGYNMVEVATLGVSDSEENLRIMQNKYDNDMATMTDLLDAYSQWQQAQSNLIEAQTQYKIYETEYLRVTGKL